MAYLWLFGTFAFFLAVFATKKFGVFCRFLGIDMAFLNTYIWQYSGLLSVWKPGSSFWVKTKINARFEYRVFTSVRINKSRNLFTVVSSFYQIFEEFVLLALSVIWGTDFLKTSDKYLALAVAGYTLTTLLQLSVIEAKTLGKNGEWQLCCCQLH